MTGVNVADWRTRPGVVEVAYYEPRNAAQLAEFALLREQAIDELQRAGLADVVALVDTNLMLARLDPRLPDGVEAQLARMLVLGEETAVFIAPPGSF